MAAATTGARVITITMMVVGVIGTIEGDAMRGLVVREMMIIIIDGPGAGPGVVMMRGVVGIRPAAAGPLY